MYGKLRGRDVISAKLWSQNVSPPLQNTIGFNFSTSFGLGLNDAFWAQRQPCSACSNTNRPVDLPPKHKRDSAQRQARKRRLHATDSSATATNDEKERHRARDIEGNKHSRRTSSPSFNCFNTSLSVRRASVSTVPDSEEDSDLEVMASPVETLELRTYFQNPNDHQRNQGLRKQFASILHANKCLKQKQDNMCSLTICPQWKVVIMHYNQCTDGLECTFDNCATSRVLLQHFEACILDDCGFCAPLKQQKPQGRRDTMSSTHSFFVQSPGNNCSIEQTSISYTGMSHASQAYFRRWGEWNETCVQTPNTTHYYSTTHMSITNVVEDGTSQEVPMETVCQTERIQRELIVMLHVQKCADIDAEIEQPRKDIMCAVPHCSRMKRTLIHVAMCRGDECQFPECNVTRSIIDHWLTCRKESCEVCAPVLKFMPALDGEEFDNDGKLVNLLYTASNRLEKLNNAQVQEQCQQPLPGSSSSLQDQYQDCPSTSAGLISTSASAPDLQSTMKRHMEGSISSDSSQSSSNSSQESSRRSSMRKKPHWDG
ncbi:unnamed protein product [Bursaphelenchus okinawaensis]|uniref:histone acetyltransferase n=1 Tax=Bursaphelenchus okinawaensis TaxID=465554 RepID=A0A811KLV1_9BILA|nr:unnamed protein product [Bursaphelenchus okinawaensis]CAG9107273.1 unnamed protein product [Bursaphelenchus okinawaensis]